MSGLNFINKGYDDIGNSTGFVTAGYIKRGATSVSSISYVQNVYNTFAYSNENNILNIDTYMVWLKITVSVLNISLIKDKIILQLI